jgi:YegS/Rv2252/BmrU family lipid kinase
MDSAVNRTVVVVNPSSQNGALGRRWDEIEGILKRELGDFQVARTAGPRDATRLARTALEEGAETVVAVGGDGTAHEVANGFFVDGKPVKPGAALGLVPFGTGGDFRKTTGIPNDVAGAAAVLKAGKRRAIDVGLLEYTAPGDKKERCVFVNIASFGIAGLVDQIVNHSSKVLGGKISFFLATARATVRYKNQRVRLFYDGDERTAETVTINNIAVANGRFFGGGMMIAPNAELDDGEFDVVTVGDIGALDMMRSAPRLYKGTHLSHPKVKARRAHRVDAAPADAGTEVLLDVDGEAPGMLPATFTLLPRALQVISPHD